MKKKRKNKLLLALFMLLSLILIVNSVFASPVLVKVDGKEYNLELTAVNRESAVVRVNNETKSLRTTQQSPYSPEIFSASFPEFKYALIDRHYATYLGDVKYVNLLILIEKNLSLSGTKTVPIAYDKNSYIFEVRNAVSINQASVRLNNGSEVLATVQNLPYNPEKVSLLSDLLYVLKYVDSNSASLLLGFEVNLLFECNENWGCSNWSSCIDNKQTRTCKDSNNCSSENNMPELEQSCSELNEIEIPACTDECNISVKACFNETAFKSCSDNDNDNCTEWSSPILCSNENIKMSCSGNGECVEIPKSMNNSILWVIGISFVAIIAGFFLINLKKIKLKSKKFGKKKY